MFSPDPGPDLFLNTDLVPGQTEFRIRQKNPDQEFTEKLL